MTRVSLIPLSGMRLCRNYDRLLDKVIISEIFTPIVPSLAPFRAPMPWERANRYAS